MIDFTVGLAENPERPEVPSVLADCGCEVFENEGMFAGENGTLCPDCVKERIETLSLEELADLCGYRRIEILKIGGLIG